MGCAASAGSGVNCCSIASIETRPSCGAVAAGASRAVVERPDRVADAAHCGARRDSSGRGHRATVLSRLHLLSPSDGAGAGFAPSAGVSGAGPMTESASCARWRTASGASSASVRPLQVRGARRRVRPLPTPQRPAIRGRERKAAISDAMSGASAPAVRRNPGCRRRCRRRAIARSRA